MDTKDSNTYSVYVHTFPNGKKYVGITKYPPKHRWANGNGYKTQPVYRAIAKYGWENIKHEVVASGLCKEDAECMEVELIASYKCIMPDGYNIEQGGSACYSLSESTKEKIRKARMGKKARIDTRLKMSLAHKGRKGVSLYGSDNPNYGNHKLAGENNPFYGKKHTQDAIEKMRAAATGKKASPETRKKMSESHKGMFTGADNPMYGVRGKDHHASKAVMQCCKDGTVIREWGSLADAERATGTAHNSISACCRGKLKTAGGYVWRYASGD